MIKTITSGNCKITAKSGDSTYVYNIHIEKKPQAKVYNSNKTKIEITNVKKSKTYFTLNFKVYNGKNTALDYEIENDKLQKKSNGKWIDIDTVAESAGVGEGISPKTSYTFSIDLTNLYNLKTIKKGKYRILVNLDGKNQFKYFKVK